MLSYQHIYHAGNMADVHKHALLAWTLDYLTQKPKPLTYMESHAGRGLYDLDSDAARKTGEAAQGIGRLEPRLPADHPYRRVLDAVRRDHGGTHYPGSPLIAAQLLREGDRIHLADLHPQEHAALRRTVPGANIHKRDGLEMAGALCPPDPRRGLLLIDPSYELAAEYDALPAAIARITRKWPVGIVMLWYPLLFDPVHRDMLARLMADHGGAFRHEVRFPPARDRHRMVGSGLFVINPPWGLDGAADQVQATFAGL